LEDLPSTKLSIEWPGFKVINKLARQNLKINTDIKLGMFIYFKEKRILKGFHEPQLSVYIALCIERDELLVSLAVKRKEDCVGLVCTL
jgi:hypothetical protein